MSAVTSELTIDELDAQVGELLPAREEMVLNFNRRVTFANIGNRSGTTLANGNVNFSGRLVVNTTRFNF